MRRGLLALIAVVLLPAALAESREVRLRSPARLRAAVVTTAGGPAVLLRWRDTARGETRWEVLRGRRRVVLRANSTRYTDRRVSSAATVSPGSSRICGG